VKKNTKKSPKKKTIHSGNLPCAKKYGELSDAGLFELSILSLMSNDIFVELKRRIELVKAMLEANEPEQALDVVNGLLKNPQETRRTV